MEERNYGVKITDKGLQWYTVESLGDKRQQTPEGFLLCLDVPVARTGIQIYEKREVPGDLTPDGDGYVRVNRDPEEVFRPETIASFQGKPVVDEHPSDNNRPIDITPENWNKFSVGVAINPRQGEGEQANFMLADLLICNQDAIKAINDGKREVSAGYEASYESTGDGKARQYNIVGNHIALVQNARCGKACSIQDHAIDCACGGVPELEPVKDEVPPIVVVPKKRFIPSGPKPNITVKMGDGMPRVKHIHIHRTVDGGLIRRKR